MLRPMLSTTDPNDLGDGVEDAHAGAHADTLEEPALDVAADLLELRRHPLGGLDRLIGGLRVALGVSNDVNHNLPRAGHGQMLLSR